MTAIDYCTLADVEAYSGVNFSDGIGPTDSEIATMITNASRMVDTYAGIQLAGTEDLVEYQDASRLMQHLVLLQQQYKMLKWAKQLHSWS